MRQIVYTVRYRPQGSWFWRRLKGVIGDGVGLTKDGNNLGSRWFSHADGRRSEVPITALFEFSKEREDVIRNDMRKEGAANI